MRYLPVFHALGAVTFIFGLMMLAPLGVSWTLADGAEAAYDEAILITLGVGALLWWMTRHHRSQELHVRDGFLLVSLT